MALLIDGYNLLHATDLFGVGAAAGTLQGSREALLAFLAATLTPSEKSRTTIVFDATDVPPGLPATYDHQGITVHFARDFPDADSMLEALIEASPRGKGVMVVSSDHRVQRAARHHGARWKDAAQWYRERQSSGQVTNPTPDGKEQPPVDDADYWTQQFSDPSTLQALYDEQNREPGKTSPARLPASRPTEEPPAGHKDQPRPTPFGEGIFEGFPPGYAEDLAKELEPDSEEE